LSIIESSPPTGPGPDAGAPEGACRRRPADAPGVEEASIFARLMAGGRPDGRNGGDAEGDAGSEGRRDPTGVLVDDPAPARLARRLSAIAETARRFRPDEAGEAPPSAAPSIVGAPPPSGQATTDATALADLVERYVRHLLVAVPSTANPVVVMRLEGLFPTGTTVILRRTERGWGLKVSSASAETARLVARCAPALQARFAAGRLGTLDVEVDGERAA
jgi:hypothetical protein